jgi:GNAT superfamily N-acetyltransferase
LVDFRIEELSLSGWPALQTQLYDGWILRFAEGHTKRSNSVNPLYPSSLPIGGKIEDCEAIYADRGLSPTFKLLEDPSQAPLDRELARRGYGILDPTSVQRLGLSSWAAKREPPSGFRVELRRDFGRGWAEDYCSLNRIEEKRAIVERILGNVICEKLVARAYIEDTLVACGYGALDQGWVGLFDIVVREGERGRGFGEGLVGAILSEARERGAGQAYLQVVAANAPAVKLYAKLGFAEAYRYWYRRG